MYASSASARPTSARPASVNIFSKRHPRIDDNSGGEVGKRNGDGEPAGGSFQQCDCAFLQRPAEELNLLILARYGDTGGQFGRVEAYDFSGPDDEYEPTRAVESDSRYCRLAASLRSGWVRFCR